MEGIDSTIPVPTPTLTSYAPTDAQEGDEGTDEGGTDEEGGKRRAKGSTGATGGISGGTRGESPGQRGAIFHTTMLKDGFEGVLNDLTVNMEQRTNCLKCRSPSMSQDLTIFFNWVR